MVWWERPLVLFVALLLALLILYILYRILKRLVSGIVDRTNRVRSRIVQTLPFIGSSGGDRGSGTASEPKYRDSSAQKAHESAQKRPLEDVLPVGAEFPAVVLEKETNSRRTELRVNKFGVEVFVEEGVPDGVSVGDEIQIQITDHSGKGNAAIARFVSFS